MDRIHVQNLLMNPTMDVSQRGTNFVFGPQEETKYTLDRWGVTGSNIEVTQCDSVPDKCQAYKSLKITKKGSENNSKLIIFQKIEGYQLRYASNKILFFSGYFHTTVAGTYSLFLKNGDLDDNCNSIVMRLKLPADTWIPLNVLLSTLPLNSGVWDFYDGIGLTLGIVLSHPDEGKINYNGRWAGNSNHKSLADQVDFSKNDEAVFRITQLQFHEGTSRIPFYELYRDIVLETLYCQRYFEVIDVMPKTLVDNSAIPYKVDKRDIPEITSDSEEGNWSTLGKTSCYQSESSTASKQAKLFINSEL